MKPTPPSDPHDIVIAAVYWLIHRYQHTRCERLAGLIEKHLDWLEARATPPRLAEAYARLWFRWRAVSLTAATHGALH